MEHRQRTGLGRPEARAYLEPLVRAARAADPSGPICFAQAQLPPDRDVMSDLFDVICLNRHYGWYVDTGEAVTALREWVRLHGKPITITEYGADALIPDRLSRAPDRP